MRLSQRTRYTIVIALCAAAIVYVFWQREQPTDASCPQSTACWP